MTFFLSLDIRSLAIRYAVVTVLRIAVLSAYGASGANLALAVLPDPIWAITMTARVPDVIHALVSGRGGVGFTMNWVLILLQIGLALGMIRYFVWRFRPQWLEGLLVVGTAAETGTVDGRGLRRTGLGTPLFMTLATIATAYVVAGAFMMLVSRGEYRSLGMAMDGAGKWPLIVALGLGLLGLAWGHRFTMGARAHLIEGFGARFLPDEHPLAQRVHTLAGRLDLPPPAVGVTSQVNAFACGSNPKDAAVIIGVPLVKAFSTEELDAVIGHELGHIVSGDMRQMQIAEGYQRMFGNVFGTVVSLVGAVAASQSRDRSTATAIRGSSRALNIVGRYLIAIGSELLVKALSRSREYHADAVGASLTSPAAMIGALDKLKQIPSQPTAMEDDFAYLMFRGLSFGNLFSTHPSFEKRKAALEAGTYLRALPRRGIAPDATR